MFIRKHNMIVHRYDNYIYEREKSYGTNEMKKADEKNAMKVKNPQEN